MALIFGIPRGQNRAKMKAWRDLHEIKAKKRQHSVWKHDDMRHLMGIATCIKDNGRNAGILEERFLS